MKPKNIIIALLIIIVLGGLAFGGYLAYQKYQENQQPPKKEAVSLEGEIVCLPHKNTEGPQTLECASGLKTDEGTHYGLSSKDSASPLTAAAGSKKRASANGVLEPATDDTYDIKGVIVVESYEFR